MASETTFKNKMINFKYCYNSWKFSGGGGRGQSEGEIPLVPHPLNKSLAAYIPGSLVGEIGEAGVARAMCTIQIINTLV